MSLQVQESEHVSLCEFYITGPCLEVDWIVASGHKMCGPTGIGFLWGRMDVLETMPPWMGGGEMIQDVFMVRAGRGPRGGDRGLSRECSSVKLASRVHLMEANE